MISTFVILLFLHLAYYIILLVKKLVDLMRFYLYLQIKGYLMYKLSEWLSCQKQIIIHILDIEFFQ